MKTPFSEANEALVAGDYEQAIGLYAAALREGSELERSIRFNLALAERRLARVRRPGAGGASGKKRPNGERSEVSASPPDRVGLYPFLTACHLAPDPQAGGRFIADNEDPHFYLDPKEIFPDGPGWYGMHVQVSSGKRNIEAKVYLDQGSGFREDQCVVLPLSGNEAGYRIFQLDAMPAGARFDPLAADGPFRVDRFEVKRLDESTAIEAMQARIKEQGGEMPNKSDPGWSLRWLWERYVETFFMSKQRVHYRDWIEEVEKPTLPSASEIASYLAGLTAPPTISVVMPVYNTPERYLRACVDSVRAQSYPHWELCIADDHSPEPHIRDVLAEYARRDARIKVTFRQENGHISRASNSALELASGDYVTLLDHDDLLPEHALYWVAREIEQNPEARIIYSDEDKIDAKGRRFDPHFKSDWNPDLFFSQNYVSHLGTYRAELLRRIGGFRAGVEGSQDQDLLLRCLPHVTADQIRHIPRILYHWRALEGSTALASGEKSYTTEAGLKALRDYFQDHGNSGIRVEAGKIPNTYRVRYPIQEPAPLVSLLIPTRDKKPVVELAVRSILEKTTYSNYEILLLDNGSVERETLDWFKQVTQADPRVRVLRYDHPFNFSAINNFGVQHARGSIIGLINNDVEVISPEWLTEMVSHASRPEIGCVGAKLYYPDGRIQHGGVILGIGGVANHAHYRCKRDHPGYFARLTAIQNYSAVTAACLLIRREIYQAVNGLDDARLAIAFNDVDFCLKVRQIGYRNLWTPYAELYHHESISRGTEDSPEKLARFHREVTTMTDRWGTALLNDPYYNKNLSVHQPDFSIGS